MNGSQVFSLLLSVSQDVHHNIHSDGLVRLWQEWLMIVRDQRKIIEVVELVHKRWGGHWLGTIINQPTSHVPI
jgi:hypothetical protein